ncbi:MAG TPA: glycosyltransferase [Ktedonobacterales bacterium]|nr:glycosyltransferase [Ktedonobacterales bacterium]
MSEREALDERRMAQQSDGAESLPQVSVITPTYNRRESLLATLRALARQTVAPTSFEALVISDGSTDGTAEACARLDVPYTLRYFEHDHQGPAAARNLGVQEARGELLVFLDDDVVPDDDLIDVYLAHHRQYQHSVAIGPLLPPSDMRLQPWVRWEEKMLLQQYADIAAGKWAPTFRQFYTGNASVSRQEVIAVGGFDPQFLRAEDVELAFRLRDRGLEFHFLPTARGLHYARRAFRSWFDIPRGYARADLLMASEPGQEWILTLMGEEFHYRQPLVRALAKRCVGHPIRCAVTTHLGAAAARMFATIPLGASEKLAVSLFSTTFNLRYWQALAEELGAARFWAILADNPPHKATAAAPMSSVPSMK